MLFKNICEYTCGWKSALKYVKCCLKTENSGLKSLTKHPLSEATTIHLLLGVTIDLGVECQ